MRDFGYRTREEVDAVERSLPDRAIARRGGRSCTRGCEGADLSQQFDAIDEEVAKLVREAREFAEASPFPEAQTATAHVYAEEAERPAVRALRSPSSRASPPTLKRRSKRSARRWPATRADLCDGRGDRQARRQLRHDQGAVRLVRAERLCDTPICERGFVGLACGAAMTGSRPVVDFMFADFVLDGFGEIVNQIAKMQYMSSGRLKMPLLLRGCIGIGHSAATHHSGSYYGIFAQIPGLRVVVPSSPYDAKGLLAHGAAVRRSRVVPGTPRDPAVQRAGAGERLRNSVRRGMRGAPRRARDRGGTGADGAPNPGRVRRARAGGNLGRSGRPPHGLAARYAGRFCNRSTRPGRLLVVDEPVAHCGFSAEIAARVADQGFNDLDAPIRRLTGAFCPTPYSPPLEDAVVPRQDEIASAIRELVQE